MPPKTEYSVVIANDLRSGRSVYYAADSSWTANVGDAELLNDERAAVRLREAVSDERGNIVIDPYLIKMSDAVSAVAIRERIRVEGPSILGQHPLLNSGSKAA